ncbi:MAG: hypothetical protein F6J87_27945 [Spirulina sp. SIO3F2]|nr:hypothetical protein [Spirulina sp. SIO3F2]
MKKQLIPGLSNLSSIGILLSITIGILSCLIITSTQFSFLITIIGILMTFAIDNYRVLQSIEQKIDSYEDYLRISNIFHSVSNIRKNRDFSEHQSQLLVDVVSDRLENFEREINRATHGQLTLNGWMNMDERTLQLAKGLKKSLLATCLWSDNPIKEAREQEYLRLLANAVKDQGVKIKRIFLVTQHELSNPEFKSRYAQDCKQGIEARYLLIEKWSANGTEPKPVDFGIWDKKVLWRYKGRHNAELYFDPQQSKQIRQYEKIFDKIWVKSNVL